MKRNKTLINICVIGIGIALYIALAATVKIPLIAHIQTDLGYIVFGAYCVWLGIPAILIGVAGCTIESIVFNGMFPPGWFVGQLFIGVVCGISLYLLKNKKSQVKYTISALVTITAVFVGIALIKTGIECYLFGIPFEIKIVKNIVAFVADVIPMLIGVFIGFKYDSAVTKFITKQKA